jgi:hypothetical protein
MPHRSEDDARLLALVYDSSDDASDWVDDTRCKYPGKFCANARAFKLSGKLHRYCEMHRRRANVNQKRWLSVRRQASSSQNVLPQRAAMPLDPVWSSLLCANVRNQGQASPQPPAPASPQVSHASSSHVTGYRTLLPEPVRLEQHPAPVDLSSEDAHILNTLFRDEPNSLEE